MRVAALYDIHGNLPALEAVLHDVRQAEVDRVVIGGDVVPGPMPRETLARLLDLDLPVQFLQGNGEVAVLAQMAGMDPGPLPEAAREVVRWTAQQLTPEDGQLLARWPKLLRVDIDQLGEVLFCHATPRNENECFTQRTPDERLVPIFAGLGRKRGSVEKGGRESILQLAYRLHLLFHQIETQSERVSHGLHCR